MKPDDDWSKPERRPKKPRKKTQRLPITRHCLACGKPFNPWPCGPGLYCQKSCSSPKNLERRQTHEMGALKGESRA